MLQIFYSLQCKHISSGKKRKKRKKKISVSVHLSSSNLETEKQCKGLNSSILSTGLLLNHTIIPPVCYAFELEEKSQFTKTHIEDRRIAPVFPSSKIRNTCYSRYYCSENSCNDWVIVHLLINSLFDQIQCTL